MDFVLLKRNDPTTKTEMDIVIVDVNYLNKRFFFLFTEFGGKVSTK